MDQRPAELAYEQRPPHDILAEAIKRRRAVLFVGAGVSMAVGLPSWQSLIEHLLDDLGLERDVVDGMHGGYQMLAEYYRLKRGGIGPLRSWLDRNWRVDPQRIAASQLHRIIVELDFPIIYTTNYDRNLETAFDVLKRPFAKISNAKEIASAGVGVTHIIKFHGDFDDDASLVLTETDFLNRLAFNSPLDIRFRADALGSTLLFVGYSMSDPNIRLLLHRIWQIWDDSGHRQDRPRSFVFVAQRNPVQEAVLANWGITTIAPPEGMAADEGLTRFLLDVGRNIERSS
ncbi:SIR2 family NAD-dependent protein deacylase [Bradyrhizobium sp. CCGE-LA001]|uniref:SIR2 family NAD-dependent protein deacylase n=1 Tax=Bradyrhizobium sp. CCGE-LA001 TaxID=1223566 RepID=UPI0002AAC966|nr:SIR2 family protein [Bradyrhizobium sp. CCGE-LA001]AMA55812.1 Sir2 family NAD-dependent protein deacetylase [Bradyrhizobium sp. CCGE-LA001]